MLPPMQPNMGNTIEQWRASIGGWTRGSVRPIGTKCRGSSCCPWFQLLVLVALLMIGGIEMNPGPNQNDSPTFEKTVGFSDMAGENYEWKMSALLFLRALQTGHQFQLASNMKAAGKFDDVVLKLGDCTVFLQLKHKKNSKTALKLRDLTRDNNFQLSKYLGSYLEMKQRWQEDTDLKSCGSFRKAKFVIYTNARMDEGLVNTAGSSELLNIVRTRGACVCLTELFDNLPKYKAALLAAVRSENVTATPELRKVVKKLYNKEARALPDKKQLQEMLEHLETLGDLTRYKQFISQLYLCTGQATEKDLDDLIAQNILNVCGTDTVLRDFKDGMRDWWKSSNCHLTAQAEFFQNIIQAITANISKITPLLNVKFLENECENIRKKFSPGNRMLFVHTQCTNLSVAKVLQSFQKNILVDVSTLETHLNETLSVWRLGMCDVLVVEGETTDTNILNKLGSMSDSKCAVVISGTAEHTQLYQQFKFASFTDTFCLSQLNSDSQTYILEHEVMFQGSRVKLNSLAEESFLQTAVTADDVVRLHHKVVFVQGLDDLDPCYLQRTFLRKEFVSEQIFREEHIVLAITGIPEDRLAQLEPRGKEVQKDKICKYFRIEGESEFTALCAKNDNIHWIQASEEELVWIKSKGDILPVLKYLKEKNVRCTVNEVLAAPHQVVLFVAEPGMGKSMEMCNVAHVIKRKDPSTWVVRVDLNQYTHLLSQNHVDAVEFLEIVATLNTEFQKRLFEHQLQSGNIVILVDGVDEVSPNYSDQVIRLLKKFCGMKVRQIIVTSRPVMLNELQQNLSTLAFSFHQFTPDDQKNFLMRFWNQLSLNSNELSDFISSLLQLVGTSLNDNLKEFTGIPLQCKMLAEVYTDEASHFCQTGDVRLPQTLDILELYDKFTDKKWEVYWRKINIDMSTTLSFLTYHKNMFQQNLMCSALVSYLHDADVRKLRSSGNVLKQNQDFVSTFNIGLDKTGIVTHIVGNKAVFIHRTFTEYFVAMWVSQNFETESIIIKKIYIDNNFVIVRNFLNRILAKGLKLHTFVLNENQAEVKSQLSIQNPELYTEDKGGRTALHLALMNCFYRKCRIYDSIVETLLEHGADINCKDKLLPWSALRLAEEVRAWSVVDKLLDKQADGKDLFWVRRNIKKQKFAESESEMSVRYRMSEALEQVMNTALCNGYVNLVKFIFECGVCVTHYITAEYRHRHTYKTTMLHIAAEHGQLILAQFLIQQGAIVDIVSDIEFNRTPLMQAAECGHAAVVQMLIAHGASVNTRNKDGHTALTLAAREGQNETVKLLLENGADVEISDDLCNRTPLMWAAERCDVEVVQLLIAHGVSVNTTDEFRYTALSLVSSDDIKQLLLLHGAHY